MSFFEVALTHSVARDKNKISYFFSRFNFDRMKERGNTHFCFSCHGDVGFKPQKVGRLFKSDDVTKPTNHIQKNGYNPMAYHDATHTNAVLGNANMYNNVWAWLSKEIKKKKDFPFVVHVPSID